MAVVILNLNISAAYLIWVQTFEKVDAGDDNVLRNIAEQRISEPFTSIKVDIDGLFHSLILKEQEKLSNELEWQFNKSF